MGNVNVWGIESVEEEGDYIRDEHAGLQRPVDEVVR